MMTPYVDSRIIEHIEQLGQETEANADGILETQEGLMETFEQTEQNVSSIEECQDALMELYEMIIGG